MAKPIVAIVGRPNVGKSTLFNKLSGTRMAIALAQEGGVSFIYGSQTVEDEAAMVAEVKSYKAGFVVSDSTLTPDNTLRDVIAQRRPIDGNSSAEEADQQENLMGQVASRLNVVIEQYPDIKANENYAKAMDAVDKYTNMVRTSKMVYNDTATKYNKLIRQIPDSFVAAMFGFKTRDYLKIEEKKADMPSLKI